MIDNFLTNLEFVAFLFVPFSILIWIKGFVWMKYHMHYNVKVRATVPASAVREKFKWNFARPYFIWVILIIITSFISGEIGEMLRFVHIIAILYIIVIKEIFTLFGWMLGEWDTRIPHISLFSRSKMSVIEQF